jgi:hypothetical protein
MSPRHRAIHTLAASVAVATLFGAAPAHALYKVVGPDGKVTYTDRPNVSTENRVQPMGSAAGGGVANDASLPFQLRQVAQRYPVVLYVAPDCAPCDEGRQFLKQRGIPYSEKLVTSPADGQALQRQTGGLSLPALSVGAQVVRGWQLENWAGYLDAAGYPKTSQLPPNYPQGKGEPLTEPQQRPAAAAPAPAPAAPSPAPEAAPAPAPSGIRF